MERMNNNLKDKEEKNDEQMTCRGFFLTCHIFHQ